jgi:hypothetical protein
MVAEMMSFIPSLMWVGLAGIWPLIGYFGAGSGLFFGLLAAAWFSPVFKKEFVWAAVVVAAFMAAFTLGVVNGEQRVRAQWTAAEENTVQQAKDARKSAERSVARKPSKWVRHKRDPDLRD